MADRITHKIVCLGGGIGTSRLLRGLKRYPVEISVVTSMADDGGSSGRLRKAYNIMPPGDVVSCIAAMMDDSDKELESLLLYRFPGQEKANKSIDGQKLGNLIMLAEIQRTKDFYKAIEATKKMVGVKGNFYPATDQRVHLWAITKDGRRVHTENTLDLARYSEPYGLKKIYINPARPKVNNKVIDALSEADIIISGPGDLYTNQLPVLIIPQIKQALLESKAKKIFIANIANKPFETRDFSLSDFTTAIQDHLETFPFEIIIANNNHENLIPRRYKYKYIKVDKDSLPDGVRLFQQDIVNDEFPLYHDPAKLAETVMKAV
jgi:uncharacterized cofD-like protein